MVYLHNFYLNPMFDPSGPRPGADAHNCTVGYVSEYKPPSLYPGVNLTTINDGDGFAQVPHPGLPRETPLVLAANTHADEGGRPLYGGWLECWGYDRSGTWRTLGGTNGGMSAEFTIPGERKEPPQIVFRAPARPANASTCGASSSAPRPTTRSSNCSRQAARSPETSCRFRRRSIDYLTDRRR